MTIRLIDNGIFLTAITLLVVAAGTTCEYWAQEVASRPYIIVVEDENTTLIQNWEVQEDLATRSMQAPDELALSRSLEHQALMSNPELTAEDETLFQMLRNLVDTEGSSPALLNDLAATAISIERYSEAVIYLRQGLELHPEYARAYFNLGLAYSKLDNFANAEQSYRKALELNPGYQSAAINLGILYLNTGDPERAAAQFNHAINITSGDNKARALSLLGSSRLRMDEPELAVANLRKAVEYNPRDAGIWLELGAALARMDGLEQEAIESLESSIALDDKQANAHYRLGEVYIKVGLWREAVNSYLSAIRREPTHNNARRRLASLFEENGDMAAAKPHYQWLSNNVTDPNEAALYRAIISEHEGRTVESIDTLYASLDENGAVHPGVLKKLGLLLRRENRNEEALSVYRRYLSAFPLEVDAFIGAAATAIELDQKAIAASYLESGIGLQSDDPGLWFMQGRLRQSMEDENLAKTSYEKCLQVDPDYRKCALNLAVIRGNEGDDVRVVELYQRILSRAPNYVPALFNLALAHRNLGHDNEAIGLYRRILALEPENDGARINLALILKNRGLLDDSEALLRDGLAIAPSEVAARYNLALLLGEKGNNSEKIVELQRVTRLDPDYEKAWRSLAYSLADQGRYKEAVSAWIETIKLHPAGSLRSAFELGDRLYTDSSSAQDRHQALRLYKAMYGARPDSAVLPRKVAELFLLEKKYQKALDVLELALAANPQHKLLWRLQAITLANQGNLDDAIVELRNLVDTHSSSARDWRLIGSWHHKLGQLDEARAAYESALVLDPGNRGARNGLEKIEKSNT